MSMRVEIAGRELHSFFKLVQGRFADRVVLLLEP
jgi:hypothetical protein